MLVDQIRSIDTGHLTRRLIEAGLLTGNRRATRDMFWAAAREWKPIWTEIDMDALGADAVAVGADVAAALGAPVISSANDTSEVLVASEVDLQVASLRPTTPTTILCRAAVAPSPVALGLDPDRGEADAGLKPAGPVVAALVLATDHVRGAEIVEDGQGTVSGSEVRLTGPAMDGLISSLRILTATDPVIVGGLAVMSRIGGEHRVTRDIDSTFNHPEGTPTTTLLVADGLAVPGGAIQRVRIGESVVDVIDTFEINDDQLPDEPKGRLFVCARRYAWETGTRLAFIGDTYRADLPVATVDALVSMKAHALRYGSTERRAKKRASDLYDVLRLAVIDGGPLLTNAPWGLAVSTRPPIAGQRIEVGHLEGDQIIGARNQTAVIPIFDRTTRYLWLARHDHPDGRYNAHTTQTAVIGVVDQIPPVLRRTLTWDRGSEMADHHAITEVTGIGQSRY